MPKVSKEKFEIDGTYERNRTTYKGKIELNLYYDSSSDRFYFENAEIREYFPDYSNDISFDKCRSKKDCMSLISNYITGSGVHKKMIQLLIGMPEDLYKPQTEDAKVLSLMDWFSHTARGLTVSYNRVMRIELNGSIIYAECKEDWSYVHTYTGSHKKEHLLEWSEDVEEFINSIQDELDKMCLKVFSFFNTPDSDELISRMLSKQHLIS